MCGSLWGFQAPPQSSVFSLRGRKPGSHSPHPSVKEPSEKEGWMSEAWSFIWVWRGTFHALRTFHWSKTGKFGPSATCPTAEAECCLTLCLQNNQNYKQVLQRRRRVLRISTMALAAAGLLASVKVQTLFIDCFDLTFIFRNVSASAAVFQLFLPSRYQNSRLLQEIPAVTFGFLMFTGCLWNRKIKAFRHSKKFVFSIFFSFWELKTKISDSAAVWRISDFASFIPFYDFPAFFCTLCTSSCCFFRTVSSYWYLWCNSLFS